MVYKRLQHAVDRRCARGVRRGVAREQAQRQQLRRLRVKEAKLCRRDTPARCRRKGRGVRHDRTRLEAATALGVEAKHEESVQVGGSGEKATTERLFEVREHD